MANIVYANPFGAALEGKRAALDDALKLRAAQDKQEYLSWYMPYMKQQHQQAQERNDLQLKEAAFQRAALEYKASGDATNMLAAAVALGMDPHVVNGMDEKQKDILAQGAINKAFAVFPNMYAAQGMARDVTPPPYTIQELETLFKSMNPETQTDPMAEVLDSWGAAPAATPGTAPTRAPRFTPTPTLADVEAANRKQKTLTGNVPTTQPDPQTQLPDWMTSWVGSNVAKPAPTMADEINNYMPKGSTPTLNYGQQQLPTHGMAAPNKPKPNAPSLIPYNISPTALPKPKPDYSSSGFNPDIEDYDPEKILVP